METARSAKLWHSVCGPLPAFHRVRPEGSVSLFLILRMLVGIWSKMGEIRVVVVLSADGFIDGRIE